MTRYKITLGFNGSPFHGWQSQDNAQAIQDWVQKALGEVLQEKVVLAGCSRTDAGVHALEYVAHFDSETTVPLESLRAGSNSHLPKEIAIFQIQEIHPDFHARKDAKAKIYQYRILNRPVRDPLAHQRIWHMDETLDVEAMKTAAHALEGTHDFSCFQGADPKPRNPVRTLLFCQVHESTSLQEQTIEIELKSSGFLKYMVRNIVGTLVEIGRGKREALSMPALLESKDRKKAGATAPASGLYLKKVIY